MLSLTINNVHFWPAPINRRAYSSSTFWECIGIIFRQVLSQIRNWPFDPFIARHTMPPPTLVVWLWQRDTNRQPEHHMIMNGTALL